MPTFPTSHPEADPGTVLARFACGYRLNRWEEEHVAIRTVSTDPDTGIPDLIRRLGDDSKRLVNDEIRLAKLEARESMHTAAKGGLWMGVAFGVAVVMLVAFTVLMVALIGRLLGNFWAGALITGALELIAAGLLIKSGLSSFAEPSYTLEETRREMKETARWVRDIPADRSNGTLRDAPSTIVPVAAADRTQAPPPPR